jgi:peptidoglycan/LPS O-acetylase OafA/YrhL
MNQRYRPDIDGLRALAILPVILFHARLGCPGGFVGVDIFFVISGFLITSLILKEINENKFSLTNFWERRIRRILPALVTVLIATIIAGWFLFFPSDFKALAEAAVAQAVFQSNTFFWQQSGYFGPDSNTQPLLHTWSLAVEEQFYLIFPMLLIILARRKKFSFTKTIVVIAVASFVLSVFGTYYHPFATFYLLPGRAWELMAGAFLAAVPARQLSNARLNEALGLFGLALILYSIFFYSPETRFPGLAAVAPCMGAALIIFSGTTTKPTLIRRVLALKPIVFIGLISYSLYLWHWPLLVFSKYGSVQTQSWEFRAVLLAISFALAIVSWKWIETPFRKRLVCPRRPHVFAFAGCSALAVLILGGGIYFDYGVPSRVPAEALRLFNYRNDYAFRNEITPQMAAAGRFAELGGQSPNQPIEILLWGDSHAMAVAPAIDELCHRFSVRGVEATHSATAPILGDFNHDPFGLGNKSSAFSKSVIDFIYKKHIKMVILAASWGNTNYGLPDSLAAGLTSTVKAIMASGAKVYVLKDVPRPGFDAPKQAALTLMRHGNLAQLAISPDKYYVKYHDYEFIFNRLSQMGATVFDTPKYFLNTNGLYDVVRNDKVLFCDEHHLTVAGSKLLLPMFEPLFDNKSFGDSQHK